MHKRMTTPEWIEKAKAVHGDRYDYSKTVYVGSTDKVTIMCPDHGEMEIEANSHLRGVGKCLRCSLVNRLSSDVVASRWATQLERFTKVHGDRYDYSKANFTKAHDPITIVCSVHGDFQQTPAKHARGSGCIQCGRIKVGRNNSDNQESALAKFVDKHGDLYDYSLVVYVDTNTPVRIGCSKHGIFAQSPRNHIQGQGCPKCAGKNTTSSEWIERAQAVHGGRYDYTDTKFVVGCASVTIGCPDHGNFEQSPSKHLQGGGCIKCGGRRLSISERLDYYATIHDNRYDYTDVIYEGVTDNIIVGCPDHGPFTVTPANHVRGKGCPKCAGRGLTHEERLERFVAVHGDRYDYSDTKYVRSDEKIAIRCKTHGEFYMLPGNHLAGQSCPKCANAGGISAAELEIGDFLQQHTTVIRSDRTIIGPKELDIVLPDHNIAIEYCGLYWHSETMGKDRRYHSDKRIRCEERGYKLITIFSDEYINKPDVIKSRLLHLIGKSSSRIFGRKCRVRIIDLNTARDFLNTHHTQGYNGCSHRYGLYHEDRLVSVMTFSKPSIAKGKKTGDGSAYEISRFASIGSVVGGGSKLVKAFIRDVGPDSIYTFADLRWGDGSGYAGMGFAHTGDSVPNYWYFKTANKRYHRFGLRKNSDDIGGLTEWENRKLQGWDRIWDCGHRKFELVLSE